MECMSCNNAINPVWTHAIEQNICPFCGKPIMEEMLKDLLTDLGAILTLLEDYPTQRDEFLRSKGFLKGNSKFVDSKKQVINVDGKETEIQSTKIADDESVKEFFKRANYKGDFDGERLSPEEKTQKLKSMVEKIKASGSEEWNPDELAEAGIENPYEELASQSTGNFMQELEGGTPNLPTIGGKSNSKDMFRLQQMYERINTSKENFASGDRKFKFTK